MTEESVKLNDAKREIEREVRLKLACLDIGSNLASVEVSDEDARRYLAGATIEELMYG